MAAYSCLFLPPALLLCFAAVTSGATLIMVSREFSLRLKLLCVEASTPTVHLLLHRTALLHLWQGVHQQKRESFITA